VPGESGELTIQLRLHGRRWWLLVPVTIGQRDISMVLDTGSPVSSISGGTYELLADTGHLHHLGGATYALRNPRIDGQPISDLPVRISRRVTQASYPGGS
jgi:hypothetical protein